MIVKLVDHFNDFLKDTVNLNQARIDTLEDRVEAIKTFLRGSTYEARIRRFSAQGSWAHKTIIRPPSDKKEFDADLVMFVDPVDHWSPSDYVLNLRRVCRTSGRYKDKTSMKTRCVTINYAGDFHLDVVPIVVDALNSEQTYSVCNRTDDEFESTDGDGFADWWHGQDTITTNNRLKKVTRLLKHLRDIKGTFSAKSVLLTTLIGQQISAFDQISNTGQFRDVPTTLMTVTDRLDDWLQARPQLPAVENPAMSGESFTRNWTQEQYDNFRDMIHKYRDWINNAYNETDRDESIRKWRRVFGEDFAKGETVERATAVVTKIAENLQQGQDMVAAVVNYGREILGRMPRMLPHVQLPSFRRSNTQIPVRIVAHERRTKGGVNIRQLESGDLIERGSGIQFQAVQKTGLPFPKDYEVQWQVVNTDKAAASDDCLRGGFYFSDTHGYRFEATKYRGVHWVQAFVVNKRTGDQYGASDRFFVVIM